MTQRAESARKVNRTIIKVKSSVDRGCVGEEWTEGEDTQTVPDALNSSLRITVCIRTWSYEFPKVVANYFICVCGWPTH
jgi:hypothetical protein